MTDMANGGLKAGLENAAKAIEGSLKRHALLSEEWMWLDAKEKKAMRERWMRAILKHVMPAT